MPTRPARSDAEALHGLGYAQELARRMLAKDSLATGRTVRELYAERGGRADIITALEDVSAHSRGGRLR